MKGSAGGGVWTIDCADRYFLSCLDALQMQQRWSEARGMWFGQSRTGRARAVDWSSSSRRATSAPSEVHDIILDRVTLQPARAHPPTLLPSSAESEFEALEWSSSKESITRIQHGVNSLIHHLE